MQMILTTWTRTIALSASGDHQQIDDSDPWRLMNLAVAPCMPKF
jgi:hypothetical protein